MIDFNRLKILTLCAVRDDYVEFFESLLTIDTYRSGGNIGLLYATLIRRKHHYLHRQFYEEFAIIIYTVGATKIHKMAMESRNTSRAS